MSDAQRRPARTSLRRFADRTRRVAKDVAATTGDVTIDVTMLGSSGVGKTTLLASMYERFGHVIGDLDLEVLATDRRTSIRLGEYIAQLREMPGSVRVTGGIAGTSQVREYTFGVGPKGNPSAFALRFTDYPGQYLLEPDLAGSERIERALAASNVILLAVDTPALVELGGRYHEMINRPQPVLDEVKRILGLSDEPRLLLITLLKCEKYVADPESAQQLVNLVTEKYKPLLDYIRTGDVRERTGCVLAPIQTIGSVRLFRVSTEDDENPVFHFRSSRVGAAYAPIDTEQPLRYILRFVINKYRQSDRPMLKGIWDRFTGVDGRLIAAVDAFAADCKTTGGFAVLQDHSLLHGARQGPAWGRRGGPA